MSAAQHIASPAWRVRLAYYLGRRRLPDLYTPWVEADIESGRWWLRLRRWSTVCVSAYVLVAAAVGILVMWTDLVAGSTTAAVSGLGGLIGVACVSLAVLLVAGLHALTGLRSSLEDGARAYQRGEASRPARVFWLPVHSHLASALVREVRKLRLGLLVGCAVVIVAVCGAIAIAALVA